MRQLSIIMCPDSSICNQLVVSIRSGNDTFIHLDACDSLVDKLDMCKDLTNSAERVFIGTCGIFFYRDLYNTSLDRFFDIFEEFDNVKFIVPQPSVAALRKYGFSHMTRDDLTKVLCRERLWTALCLELVLNKFSPYGADSRNGLRHLHEDRMIALGNPEKVEDAHVIAEELLREINLNALISGINVSFIDIMLEDDSKPKL